MAKSLDKREASNANPTSPSRVFGSVEFGIEGDFSEDILEDLSETTINSMIDDVRKNLMESSGLSAEDLKDATLVWVPASRSRERRAAGGSLQVVFNLPEDVDQSSASEALSAYNAAVETFEPLTFTTKNGVSKVAAPAAAKAAPPVVTVVTLPAVLDASSSTMFTADDVLTIMEDPAVKEIMTQLSESMGFQNEVTDAENFVPATTTTTTIFGNTNSSTADDDDGGDPRDAGDLESILWGLNSTAMLAIIASLAALAVCGFTAACIFGCSCCSSCQRGGSAAKLNTMIANESMAANAEEMSVMQGPSPAGAPGVPFAPASTQYPYFDVVPELPNNDEFDFNVDDELSAYGHGEDIQYIMDGGDPTQANGNWAVPSYTGYGQTDQGAFAANQGYDDGTYGYGADQGYGQSAGYGPDQAYPAEAYDQEGMDVLYDQDQEYFDQQFENPMHNSQAGGGYGYDQNTMM